MVTRRQHCQLPGGLAAFTIVRRWTLQGSRTGTFIGSSKGRLHARSAL
jgi:hypothetical protein